MRIQPLVFKVHLLTGLLVGPIFVLTGLSGSSLVFRMELRKRLYSEPERVEVPDDLLKDIRLSKRRWARAWEGQALSALGRSPLAIAAFDRALRPRDPRFSVVHLWKAEALKARGKS